MNQSNLELSKQVIYQQQMLRLRDKYLKRTEEQAAARLVKTKYYLI
jgi:hypothetical protein